MAYQKCLASNLKSVKSTALFNMPDNHQTYTHAGLHMQDAQRHEVDVADVEVAGLQIECSTEEPCAVFP